MKIYKEATGTHLDAVAHNWNVYRTTTGTGVYNPDMNSYWDYELLCWVENDKAIRARIIERINRI